MIHVSKKPYYPLYTPNDALQRRCTAWKRLNDALRKRIGSGSMANQGEDAHERTKIGLFAVMDSCEMNVVCYSASLAAQAAR